MNNGKEILEFILNKLVLKILDGVVKEDNSSAVYHNAVLLNIIF
jgi:hypothetical protein